MQILKYSLDSVPTVERFIKSRARYKLIMGPLGSGKSTGCVIHLFNEMISQKPDAQGVRRTRYAVVRNTAPQLNYTTKKTIDEWIPDTIREWSESKRTYFFKFRLGDGTIVESEWILKHLDNEEQVRDLLSLDLTGAWLNEAREIREDVFKMLRGRINRYPPKRLYKVGATYPFIIMDTNPPHTEHWLYKLFEELPKVDHKWAKLIEVFKQPSARSPQAENLPNLAPNYYEELMYGQDEDWIRVYVDGEYGYVKAGKPVFPSYKDSFHCAREPIEPMERRPVIIGMDFGLTPAAVFVQLTLEGQLRVLHEIVTEDATDLETFVIEYLLPVMNDMFFNCPSYIVGDPAGKSRSQVDSRSCFHVLNSFGLRAFPAYTNSLQERLRAVNIYLTRTVKGNEPAFLLSPTCKYLRKGFISEYHFRKLRVMGDRYADTPEKNIYSHVFDALQYACLGLMAMNREFYKEEDEFFSREEKSSSYSRMEAFV